MSDPSEKAERLRLLDELLARLAPKKRLVLVLVEIEGVPIEEVAKIAGCPENTAWSRLHYARAELMAMARKRAK
jgi:RNA polymerase sigma-70 factor (ECF subfamily)